MNSTNPRKRRLITMGVIGSAILLAGGALVGVTSASASTSQPSTHSARADTKKTATKPKPTVVLVHGAWADSGSWNVVVQRLQDDGYAVNVFPTPLESLSTDTVALKDYLAVISGPIVLVGHSYGGAVVTDAATGNANVRALVYLDAFAPAEGQPVGGYVQGTTSAVGGDPTATFNFVGSDPSNPELYVKPSLFVSAFANDLPKAEAKVLAATQRPVALKALGEPSTTPAWKTITSWYEVGTEDKVIPPAIQTSMAQAAGAHIIEAPTGHLPMISKPATVTHTIETAAAATS